MIDLGRSRRPPAKALNLPGSTRRKGLYAFGYYIAIAIVVILSALN